MNFIIIATVLALIGLTLVFVGINKPNKEKILEFFVMSDMIAGDKSSLCLFLSRSNGTKERLAKVIPFARRCGYRLAKSEDLEQFHEVPEMLIMASDTNEIIMFNRVLNKKYTLSQDNVTRSIRQPFAFIVEGKKHRR